MSDQPSSRRVWAAPATVLALLALTAALVGTVLGGGTLGNSRPLYGWYVLDAVLFGLAVALLRLTPPRAATRLLLAGGVLVAAAGLVAPPRTSDDAYRYLWDGRVQAAGISPYAHPPDAAELAGLRARAPELFPPGGDCGGWDERRAAAGFCSHVNRPGVPTVYPPVAEAWFAALYGAGGRYGVRAAQLGGFVLVLAVGAVLAAVLRERCWRVALWSWCPGVTVWAVNDAHVDTLGALLLLAGLLAARGAPGRRRTAGAGALLGLAAATKLIPGIALPAALSGVLARRPRTGLLLLPLTALAAFGLSYLPYLVGSGRAVLGYLPGYLREEGYDRSSGADRFGLLRLLLPGQLALVAGVLVLLAACWYVLRHGDPDRPWRGAVLLLGTALLVATPAYPWYGLLLLALLPLDGRWEWLAVPAAGQVLYLGGGQWAYGAALAAVVTGALVRRAAAGR
ncbi:glycosyltransferase 87 family protein [Kitasatospora sp. NPDC002040]|uniref:glycosyltransferase 87 family protein n=1 Tax=Kitasatospora sp. NPDC002040 TaxID=3154661 RepID=UPI00332FE1C5